MAKLLIGLVTSDYLKYVSHIDYNKMIVDLLFESIDVFKVHTNKVILARAYFNLGQYLIIHSQQSFLVEEVLTSISSLKKAIKLFKKLDDEYMHLVATIQLMYAQEMMKKKC